MGKLVILALGLALVASIALTMLAFGAHLVRLRFDRWRAS